MLKKGPLYVLACYILWGLLPVFWKTLAEVNSLYVLASRILWSLLLVTAFLAARRRFGEVRAVLADKKEWKRLVLAGCFICVNWGSFIWAVNGGHLLDSSLAYYMSPILSILLGTLFFHERLTRVQWLAVGITFTGLVIAVIRYGQIPWIALIIGGSFSIYSALKKGVHCQAETSMFFETAVLAPFALAFVFWAESRGSGAVGVLVGWQWVLLPVAGFVTTLPLVLFSKGIQDTPMSLAGILMYINPTIQLLLSVLVYHEEFTLTHVILFGFVWTGLALYLASGLRQRRKEKEMASCA
ncbi:MAG: EamA family transporter RarD [Oscillibacter sp.]